MNQMGFPEDCETRLAVWLITFDPDLIRNLDN